MEESILKELQRIRKAKRALAAEIELLRQSCEEGRMRLRVNSSQNFRLKVATAIVKESDPGYYDSGRYYADVVKGIVYFKKFNSRGNPWKDSDAYKIFMCCELVDRNQNNFSPQVDWKVTDLHDYANMRKEYLAAEDSNSNEVINADDVIEFARNYRRDWAQLIQATEESEFNNAVEFALENIFDEVTSDVTQS